jgi:hypothetical protein
MLPGVNDFVWSTEPHFVQTTEAAIGKGVISPPHPTRLVPTRNRSVRPSADVALKGGSLWTAHMSSTFVTPATARSGSRLSSVSPAGSSARRATSASGSIPKRRSATSRRSGAANATAVRPAAPLRIPA